MVYWREFLMVAGAHLLAVMSPGPDFALICRNSMAYSRRAGVLAAVGLGLGILVHVAYCIFGLRELMAVSGVILRVLQYTGAAYLVYIGVRSLLARRSALPQDEATIKDMPRGHAVRTGFITNVTNPKAMLFFMALFAMVSPQTPRMIQVLYGVEMSIATFGWFAFVATVLSAPPIRSRFLGMAIWIEGVMGVVLIVLGVKVALSVI